MSILIRILVLICVVVLCLFPVFSTAESSGKASEEYDPLFSLAEPFGFKLGGCFSFDDLNRPAYLAFVSRHFNSLTCTNETKAYSLLDQAASQKSEDGMPRMNYMRADRMLTYARAHNIGVRGHVLVWDAYMTPWFSMRATM